MPKLIATISAASGYTQATDYIFKKTIAGDVESVRERFTAALENLDYRVVSHQPLIAKRNAQASSCSFDVLKCVKSLTIDLTTLNPTSTLATFDYEIINPLVTRGDRQTMEREADAIVALATARPAAKFCAGCGTNSEDARFCRLCGAPNIEREPAELEVLRLTAGARPAHQFIILGSISALVVAALALYLILFSGKGPKAGLTLLAVGEIFAASCLLYGMWRLHRTLNPTKEAQIDLPLNAPLELKSPQTAALTPQSAHASVTEGTTELLLTPDPERVPARVQSHKVDTSEMR